MVKGSRFVYNVPSFTAGTAREGGISSSVRSFGGFDWEVQLFPGGKGAGKGTHAGVHLHCCGPTDVWRPGGKWVSPKVHISFAVIRKKRHHFPVRSAEPTAFSASISGGGFNDWFPLENLEGKNTLLNDDGSLDIDVCIEEVGDTTATGTGRKRSPPSARYEPSLTHLLDNPQASYADISLSGNDGEPPIRAHRAVLGYRVEYFQKLFDFPGAKRDLRSTRVAADANLTFSIAELSTKALLALLRRIYGNIFSQRLSEEENVDVLLEIWHFTTVGVMDGLPQECATLVKVAVSEKSFASCYRMAVLLDDTDVLRFLAARMSDFATMAKDVVNTFTVDDMHSLLSLARPGLKPLVWADAWVKYDAERSCFGEELFKSFQLDKLPASQFSEFGALDIVARNATRDSLIELLRNCQS